MGSLGIKVKVVLPTCPVSEVSLCLSPEGSLLSDLKRGTAFKAPTSHLGYQSVELDARDQGLPLPTCVFFLSLSVSGCFLLYCPQGAFLPGLSLNISFPLGFSPFLLLWSPLFLPVFSRPQS